jgi:phage terminase Nu1 subunit (DNA packaging protein)
MLTLAEIELAEKRGELLPAKDVESRLVNVFAHCKTKLLGVPARARQRDPSLTGPQVALIETLIREALEDLASAAED